MSVFIGLHQSRKQRETVQETTFSLKVCKRKHCERLDRICQESEQSVRQ
jgi:hypothetical protein